MILCFKILHLSLNKINFHFCNFLSIFTQQHGKVGQNWHFANYAKSDEIRWFCGDITKIAPLLGLKCAFQAKIETLFCKFTEKNDWGNYILAC